MSLLGDQPNIAAFEFVLRPTQEVREETKAKIAEARQLLKETEEMAEGYKPTKQ